MLHAYDLKALPLLESVINDDVPSITCFTILHHGTVLSQPEIMRAGITFEVTLWTTRNNSTRLTICRVDTPGLAFFSAAVPDAQTPLMRRFFCFSIRVGCTVPPSFHPLGAAGVP